MFFSKEAGVDDYNDFHVFHYYDDSMTLGIVGAVSKILGEYSKFGQKWSTFDWTKLDSKSNSAGLDKLF